MGDLDFETKSMKNSFNGERSSLVCLQRMFNVKMQCAELMKDPVDYDLPFTH
jgi:hypothetical protein